MVDPDRKINILTEDQETFLEECEEEFKNRFTEEDEEYMAYVKREPETPPIVHPWQMRRHFNQNRGGDNRRDNFRGRYNNFHHNRGHNRNEYKDRSDRGGHGYHSYYDNRQNRDFNNRY